LQEKTVPGSNRSFYLCLALAILFGLQDGYGDGKRAQEIINKVHKKYKDLKSLDADFEQTYIWERAGETQTVTGTIYLTASNQYRIETNEQLVITDGKTVWSYSPNDKHVIIDVLDKSQENQLPKDILLQYSKDYDPDYVGEEQIDGRKTFLLNLVPKDQEGLISSMKVWVDASTWFTRKIEQVDLNDNRNTYFVRNIRENPKLDARLFNFEIPEGAEIVDLRQDR
jgi:outer membrane lipoprotein carrier protein